MTQSIPADLSAALADEMQTLLAKLAASPITELPTEFIVYTLSIEQRGRTVGLAAARRHVYPVPPLPEDFAERMAMVFSVGFIAGFEAVNRREFPVAAFVNSEGWMSSDPQKHSRPSLDPNRREILFLAGMNMERQAVLAVQHIQRGAANAMHPESEPVFATDINATTAQSPLMESFVNGLAALWEHPGILESSPSDSDPIH